MPHPHLAALTRHAVAGVPALGDASGRFPLRVDADGPVPVAVDPLRLEQVVTNVLDNAVKYSPAGGAVDVRVTVPRPGLARITVRDHGLGIPAADRGRVFERFHRVHAGNPGEAGPVVGGIGLGLYIARQIVELHGGEIRAEFPADGGSRFVVRLPLPRETARPTRP